MSVHAPDRPRWLREEQDYVGEALRTGKRVLGLCLGAQLMAAALGARVFPGPHREIGWFPVRRVAGPGHRLVRAGPDTFDALHWHGDTFDLPTGAVPLFASEATPLQAFAWGRRALALQFHLEMRSSDLRRLARRCPGDLQPGPCVQTPAAMLADLSRFRRAQRRMDRLLDAMAAA